MENEHNPVGRKTARLLAPHQRGRDSIHWGGELDIGYRSWAGSKRHVIANNILTVEEGGSCELAMDIRGTETTVTGNNLHTFSPTNTTRLRLTAGSAVISANVFENTVIEVDDQTGADLPILIHGNVLRNARVAHRKGKVLNAAGSGE